MKTIDLMQVFQQEIDTAKRWVSAGIVKDYKVEFGCVWLKLLDEGQLCPDEWQLYWSMSEQVKPHRPTEADLF